MFYELMFLKPFMNQKTSIQNYRGHKCEISYEKMRVQGKNYTQPCPQCLLHCHWLGDTMVLIIFFSLTIWTLNMFFVDSDYIRRGPWLTPDINLTVCPCLTEFMDNFLVSSVKEPWRCQYNFRSTLLWHTEFKKPIR